MCGICGFTGPENDHILTQMTHTLTHRGPDDEGYYSDHAINLGFRRLSIIDVETGQQPVHSADKNVWSVFNGEIYNYIELRRELEKKGHQFYTDHADSELIPHLYQEYGIDFVHHLNGMFAIALWDKQAKQLFLIRDRMGVKPLYYALLNGQLIFASEIKAILAHPAYPKEPNFQALYHYFSFKNIPSPMTAFKQIECLRPGQWLRYQSGAIKKELYWEIPYQENEDFEELEAQSKIRSLLEDAVKLRMRSDVSFGAYLSGGVDSSSVVALMSQFSTQPVKTFALGYQEDLKNKAADLHYARWVSNHYQTDHHEYIMSAEELTCDVDQVIRAFDQPFSGTISTFFLSKLIAQHVKVALSGDGADELFGSYLTHRVAQPLHHYQRLFTRIQQGDLTAAEQELLLPCDIDFLHELFQQSTGDMALWKMALMPFADQDKEGLFSSQLLNNTIFTPTIDILRKDISTLKAKQPLNRILELEWKTQLCDQVLAFVDFLSMAHSVEVRSPFLDYRLVEFAATIPGQYKINQGRVKDILKQAVAPLLPTEILERPKEGFVLPVYHWMLNSLNDYCQSILSKARLTKHGLLNVGTVEQLLNAYLAGETKNASKVWNLMMFQVWWEEYFA